MIESRCILTGSRAAVLAHSLRQKRDLGHGLVWTLFERDPPPERDFLYLVEQQRPFTVIVRSARQPEPNGLWTIERSYPFRPVLRQGQVLSFRVTCVATVHVRRAGEPKTDRERRRSTVRQDVILAAWKNLPDHAMRSAEELAMVADKAATDWLSRQGQRHGFELLEQRAGIADDAEPLVVSYDRHQLPRHGSKNATFGSIIFQGLLRITDVTPFCAMLQCGLGTERAFGFGLVQIAQPRNPAG